MSADFLDSNVLVYLFDNTDQPKRLTAEGLVGTALAGSGSISFQVVQETLNALAAKVTPAPSVDDVRRLLDGVLTPLCRVFPGGDLYHRAIDVRLRYGYRFYDSLIIAAALGSGCTRLYSEDLHDGQRIGRLTIVNPFRA